MMRYCTRNLPNHPSQKVGLHFRMQNLVSQFLSYWKSFYTSLEVKHDTPTHFWRLSLEDGLCFAFMMFVTLSVWNGVIFQGNFSAILCYWDGPKYVFAAITMYEISPDNPWTKYFKYNPSYFACHLPGFPLVIRFFAFFTLGNYYIADLLAIWFCSLLLCYSFRRVLIAYQCVANPTFTTMMLSCIPMRLVIYHSIGASEPLFISELCLAFTFYKLGMHTAVLIAVWACCITRIEGMAVGAAIGMCYVLRFDIVNGLSMFLTFLAPISLMIMHKSLFGDALAYLTFNSGKQRLIGLPPLPEMSPGRIRYSNTNYVHSFVDFYFPYVFGAALVLIKAGPLGIFSFIHLAYVGVLRHLDLYRYSLPAGVFSVLVGFDLLWSHAITKNAMMIMAPFYWFEVVTYAAGQINSNKCGDFFLREVMEAAKDHIH